MLFSYKKEYRAACQDPGVARDAGTCAHGFGFWSIYSGMAVRSLIWYYCPLARWRTEESCSASVPHNDTTGSLKIHLRRVNSSNVIKAWKKVWTPWAKREFLKQPL